jgi:hypothetical protein
MYLLALRTGGAFAFFGYVWADSCWVLKLGQLIAANGLVPKADLFSFTLPLCAQLGIPQPYVVYQWLSELLFYLGYNWFGLTGLLVAGSVIMTLAFLIIPLRLCVRANAPAVWSFLAVAAASLSANIRCVIRPEIFSYLNLAICLALLQPLRSENSTSSVNWRTVISLALLMIAWSNMHSGFVSGLILIAIYALCFLLEDLMARKPFSGATRTLCCALALSSLATLVNPYGIGLWFYLPHLFFMPINAQIDECKPLIGVPLYLAIYFLSATILCSAALAVGVYRIGRDEPKVLSSPVRQSSLLIALIATFLGFWMRRLTPMAALIMVVETANYIGVKTEAGRWPSSIWSRKISYVAFELVMLIAAFQGVSMLAGKSITVTVPSITQEFKPPFSALQFFMKEHHDGRVFSSLPISDMLDLYWGPHSALFIDSRLDAYSDKTIEEYLTMLYGKEGWRDLIDQYQIKWIFLSPDKPVCKLLEESPEWNMVYKDSTARIFKRR